MTSDEIRERLKQLPPWPDVTQDGVDLALKLLEIKAEPALIQARKVLECLVSRLYTERTGEPVGNRTVEDLINTLHKGGHLSASLAVKANHVRAYGNLGAHRFGESVAERDVLTVLGYVLDIVEWYLLVRPSPAPPASPPVTISTPAAPAAKPARAKSATVPAARPSWAPPPPLVPSPPADTATPAGPGPGPAIIPKGLRSFDREDSYFFLELLPGPCDQEGLPDALRFWKQRIDHDDPSHFTVGLIHGPSGCGKSSLVKAGLLPRLSPRVLAVYVEATRDDTERRLLHALHRCLPDLPADIGIVEAVTAIAQQGRYLPAGKKLLIVLDQFEQRLHGRVDDRHSELVRALRQCDAVHVQCLLMVRDDYWTPVNRFSEALDIKLSDSSNSRAVDLFDLDHARRVLYHFGCAYERLPKDADSLTDEQQQFLDDAVQSLAQDGRVIPIRISVLAEMLRTKPWSRSSLRAAGGAEGIGVKFLEETFASPEHRRHQEAAMRILDALLPGSGAEIKGHMRSRAELLDVSGYAERPEEFEHLLHMLNVEVRLLTPTGPEGPQAAAETAAASQQYYQLTHDFLVPSLREWLMLKFGKTRRGRTKMRLAERARVWIDNPIDQYLPTLPEWLKIRWRTRSAEWTAPQRKMMRRANRYYSSRLALAVGLALLLGAVGLDVFGRIQANSLVSGLRNARAQPEKLDGVVQRMARYRYWTNPRLRAIVADAAAYQTDEVWGAHYALLPDPDSVDYFCRQLCEAEDPPGMLKNRNVLASASDQVPDFHRRVVEPLRKEVGNKQQPGRQCAAMLALLTFDPAAAKEVPLRDNLSLTAKYLSRWVEDNKDHLSQVCAGLAPVRDLLRPHFTECRDSEVAKEKLGAAALLTALDADSPALLVEYLLQSKDLASILKHRNALGRLRDRASDFQGQVIEPLRKAAANKKQEGRQCAATVALLTFDRPNLSEVLWRDSLRVLAQRLTQWAVDESQLSKIREEFAGSRELLRPYLWSYFDSPDEKTMLAAAAILATLDSDSPVRLVDYVLEGNDKQLPYLMESVKKYREKALPRLRAVLKLEAGEGKTAKPIGEAPPMSLVQEFDGAEAMLAESFAYVVRLPLQKLDATDQALHEQGYRIAVLRPFACPDGTAAAVLWLRDGRSAKSEVGLTREAWQDADKRHRNAGLAPEGVASYLEKTGEERQPKYAGVWVSNKDALGCEVALGLHFRTFCNRDNDLSEQQWTLASIHCARGPANVPLYSGIWRPNCDGPARSFVWSKPASGMSERDSESPAQEFLDVALFPLPRAINAQTFWEEQLSCSQGVRDGGADGFRNFLSPYDALYHLHRFQDVIDLSTRHLSDPRSARSAPTIRYWRSMCFARLGDKERAFQELESLKQVNATGDISPLSDTGVVIAEAFALFGRGDDKQAETLLESRLDQDPDTYGYNAACAYSLASDSLGNRDAERKQRYAERSLDLLSRRVRDGNVEPTHCLTDDDLSAARARSEFARLRRELGDVEIAGIALGAGGSRYESVALAAQEHRNRAAAVAKQGWSPITISAAIQESGEVLVASVWDKQAHVRGMDRRANAYIALKSLGDADFVQAWFAQTRKADPELGTHIMRRAGTYDPNRRLKLVAETDGDAGRPAEQGSTEFSEEKVWADLETVKVQHLDWDNTTGDARQWWLAFEEENKTRIGLVLKVAQEIQKRKATITDFFLAYVYSNSDNIQGTLAKLDEIIEMKTTSKKEKAQPAPEEQTPERIDRERLSWDRLPPEVREWWSGLEDRLPASTLQALICEMEERGASLDLVYQTWRVVKFGPPGERPKSDKELLEDRTTLDVMDRLRAVSLIGTSQQEATAAALKALQGSSDALRSLTLRALDQLDLDRPALDAELARLIRMGTAQAKTEVITYLGFRGKEPAETSRETLGDRLWALLTNRDAARLGVVLVEVLVEALRDPEPQVRAAAVAAVGQLPAVSEKAAEQLLATTGDQSPEVRRTAVSAISKLAAPRALSVLLAATGDRETSVQLAALSALADRASDRLVDQADIVVSAMLGLLERDTADVDLVKADAVRVLKSLGPVARDAVPALEAELHRVQLGNSRIPEHDESNFLGRFLLESRLRDALVALTGEARYGREIDRGLLGWDRLPGDVRQWWRELEEKESFDDLHEILRDLRRRNLGLVLYFRAALITGSDDVSNNLRLLDSLQEVSLIGVSEAEATDTAVKALQGHNPVFRALTLRALNHLPLDVGRVDAELIRLAQTADVKLKKTVLATIGQRLASPARPAASPGDDSPHPPAKEPTVPSDAPAPALQSRTPALLTVLIQAVQDEQREIREVALPFLGTIDAPEALSVLLDVVENGADDDRVDACVALRRRASKSLTMDPDKSVPVLVAVLQRDQSRDPAIPRAEVISVGREDTFALKCRAAEALGAMKSAAQAAVPALEAELSSADKKSGLPAALRGALFSITGDEKWRPQEPAKPTGETLRTR